MLSIDCAIASSVPSGGGGGDTVCRTHVSDPCVSGGSGGGSSFLYMYIILWVRVHTRLKCYINYFSLI